MSEDTCAGTSGKPLPGSGAHRKAAAQHRLAEALRANLRRRKASGGPSSVKETAGVAPAEDEG